MPFTLDFTVNGQPARLFTFRCNWKDAVGVRHTLRAELAEGALGLEARRPLFAEFMTRQRFSLLLADAALDAYREAVKTLGGRLVAVPMWADAVEPNTGLWEGRIYAPQYACAWKRDGSVAPIVFQVSSTPAAGVLAGYDLMAPLLVGRIPEGVTLNPFNGSAADLVLDVEESSPWEYRVGVRLVPGATWTEAPNRRDKPEEGISTRAEAVRIGEERNPPMASENAHAKWKQSAGFLFRSRDDIRNALSVFTNCKGPVLPIPNFPSIIEPSTPGPNTPTSYAVRFEEESFDLNFYAPGCAASQLSFVETLTASGYVQARPARAYLIRFTYAFDEANPELWTSWQAPVTLTGVGTFAPAAIRPNGIRTAMELQGCKAEVSMGKVDGSLLHDYERERLDAPLSMTVWKCDVDTPDTTAAILFDGTITELKARGREYTAIADFMAGMMDRQVPCYYFSRKCNWVLFGYGCGVAPASFVTSATLLPAHLSADGMSTLIPASGWNVGTPNNFAGGVFDVGTGRDRMVRQVVSSALESGKLRLNFAKCLWPDILAKYPSGMACTIKPGCSGSYTDCKRFGGSYANRFGAFPNIPAYIETPAPNSHKMGK